MSCLSFRKDQAIAQPPPLAVQIWSGCGTQMRRKGGELPNLVDGRSDSDFHRARFLMTRSWWHRLHIIRTLMSSSFVSCLGPFHPLEASETYRSMTMPAKVSYSRVKQKPTAPWAWVRKRTHHRRHSTYHLSVMKSHAHLQRISSYRRIFLGSS